MTKDELIKALQQLQVPGSTKIVVSIKFIDNYGEIDYVESKAIGVVNVYDYHIVIDTVPCSN